MSFYDVSIGQALEVLDSLTAILKKAEAAPNAATLPEARIHEDMLPLSFQIYIVTDLGTKLAARLTGQEPPSNENNLKSFAEFHARIAESRAALEKADKNTINSRASEAVTVGLGPGKSAQMNGLTYNAGYATPNLYFHLATAYNILRKEGVPLGKMDYLTSFLGKHVDL
ncbi:hypothetical protein LMH87_000733 [Akanthomyces muscarius]|uniref:Uncharacterized protein n=2 Tax=Akanthomyces TaxID=150366 RepID=A0A168C0K1_CORDF|nr:hypothetical protein LMH87_000733 [Akanthomyces muscarius]KAJ4155493.1 hypothetical protein LMH87_000733 [Akanthomyces muscarius]OAA70780.1 hypothetical protein LEL_09371 [Akanthomyces lecanii RCEF 1005]